MPAVVAPGNELARAAVATAYSGDASRATDESTDVYPGDHGREWVTRGQKNGAWLRLDLKRPTRFSTVLLYDRPSTDDHVEAATLEFSDGTRVDVPALPNDGCLPAVVRFPVKTCSWLKLTIAGCGGRTQNIDLSEIAVTDSSPDDATPR